MIKPFKFPISLYLLLVFLSGVLVGWFAFRFYTVRLNSFDHRPKTAEEYRNNYIREMQARLKLTPEQVTQLGQILDATQSRYREVRDRMRPELKAIQQQQVEQIESILTPTQREQYRKIREERERLRGLHEKQSR